MNTTSRIFQSKTRVNNSIKLMFKEIRGFNILWAVFRIHFILMRIRIRFRNNGSLFCYSDPDQRFLKWIRIRPNDTDPTGSRSVSRSETLLMRIITLLNQWPFTCYSWFHIKVLGVYTRSMETIYLSLRAQVAVGTFLMKSR